MKPFLPVLTAGCLLLSAVTLRGKEDCRKLPEPFAVLDLEAGRALLPETVVQETDYFESVPVAERNGRPFLISAADYHTLKLHENAASESPFLRKNLNVFSPPGEYVLRTFVFRSYAALPGAAFQISGLSDSSGGSIGEENILVFRIAKPKENYPNADLLLSPEMKSVEKNTLAFFAVLIHVPSTAKPGLYCGKIEAVAGDEKQELAVNCRVMNLSLPASDAAFGSYMPYYPYDILPVIASRRRALPCYTSENQENYFRFCRTRGLNSQTLCEFDLKFKEKGGSALDFSELDRQIELLRKTGQDKAVILDCRSLNRKAEELAKMDRFKKEGKDAVALYKELAGQLVTHAKEKNYPRFLLFAEEEAGNGGIKLAHYNKFGKILQQIAGTEHSIVVDLEVGPGRNNAIDRGSVDGYKYRQYNNWTEEALAKARREGAVVWSYNYGGFGRPAFGFIQQRLGSLGFHQWADQWGKEWTYNVPTSRGAISSLRFESSHEGTVDYRYIQALKKIDPKLAVELVAPIPVSREDSQAYFHSRNLEEFDLLRWRAALRLDPSFVPAPVSGKPELRTTQVKIVSSIQNKDLSLTAARVNEDYLADASGRNASRPGAANNTGPLRYTLAKEKKLRAYSADMEQIKKLLTPSYCESFVNFNDKGLILFSRVNHMKYGESSPRGDNDPELWKDNCLEFFFRPPGGVRYQFIVNSSGKKVFLRNNSVVEASGIQCVLTERKGGAGGYWQEALIPWRYFDRTSKPSDGEVWAFNAAREFHTWNQLTQWAASDGFWDDSRWGALKFSWKKPGEYLKKVAMPDFFRPGRNVLEGSIPGDKPLRIVLSDGNGRAMMEKQLSPKDRHFRFELELIPDAGTMQRLSVLDGDKVLEYEMIPVRSFSSAFSSDKTELECWTGGIVTFTLNANFSQYGIPEDAAVLAIRDSRNRETAVFPIHFNGNGALVCWLKTDGLVPGNYMVEPVLKDKLKDVFKAQCKLKLTVYPAAVP